MTSFAALAWVRALSHDNAAGQSSSTARRVRSSGRPTLPRCRCLPEAEPCLANAVARGTAGIVEIQTAPRGPVLSWRMRTAIRSSGRACLLRLGITPVILVVVKTAISVPDRVFDAAERVAKRLGISRSELYARAVAGFVEEHRADKVTDALDRLYSEVHSSLDPTLGRLQAVSLPKDEW